MKKLLGKLKLAFRQNKWETVYASKCTCSYVSVLYGTGKAEAVTLIQVERSKNKHRAILKVCGNSQSIDIAEVCVDNLEAQEACRKEGIVW